MGRLKKGLCKAIRASIRKRTHKKSVGHIKGC